jgi:hypothetical protein
VSTPPREPSEEQLRAAYEAELKRVTIGDVLLQTVVSLINLAGRRLGLTPESQDERDLDQVRDAIDAVRGLMPVLERRGTPELAAIRDALSRLQLAYAQEQAAAPPESPSPAGTGSPSSEGSGAAAPAGKPPEPGSEGGERRPGPAESSGRLWVPGR